MSADQLGLFRSGPALPEGFDYRPDFLTAEEERMIVERFADLPFTEFQFQGFVGKRRVVSFGWRYDFNTMKLERAAAMPDYLLPVRDRAAELAGIRADDLQHVLLTEYSPGAGIGWHKDRSVFAEVIGISLGAACVFRLRKKHGATWKRASVVVEPRSAYVLTGPARRDWEHSIPSVESLRYSITFRKLRAA